MVQVLRSILSRLARFVLSLRYRVHLHGREVLPTLKGPVLLLPNHPAYVDPVLFLITFYPALRPRIVFSEENFPQAIVGPLTKLLNGIAIPARGRQSQEARSENGPRVAVEGVDQGEGTESGPGSRRKIVLFTTEPISLQDANRLLAEAGFHGIMRIDEVHPLDQIPLLGNGKADYKRLRSLVQETLSPAG